MLTLLVVLTSASPVATGLEISSTGSLPPHERSHRNRSHALHRAQRRHPRHGFSCGPTFLQLRSPAAAAQVSGLDLLAIKAKAAAVGDHNGLVVAPVLGLADAAINSAGAKVLIVLVEKCYPTSKGAIDELPSNPGRPAQRVSQQGAFPIRVESVQLVSRHEHRRRAI